MRSRIISAVISGSLLISTTAAAAQQPTPLPSRTGTGVAESEEIAGTFMIVGLVVVVAIILGVILLDDDDDDLPTSP
jgi:hypothetical protein